MRYLYSQYIDDDLWLIKETEWARPLQGVRESQFALGNGYFGARGILEEIPPDAMPGTYISGVYDKMLSQVTELVNLPNAFNFRIAVKGEKLGVAAADVLQYKRILNLKKGLLYRYTMYQNSKKSRFDYKSIRFISMADKNIGAMQIALTPLDDPCEIDINTGIDTSVSNAGVLSEGRKRHFRVVELGQSKNAGYLAAQTLEKKHNIIYWAGFYYETGGRKTFARDNIFTLELKKNQTVIFTKLFYIKRFPVDNNLSKHKQDAFRKFYGVFHADFDTIIEGHIKAWKRLWQKADILIEGTANLQQNLRFNIYHMLICAHADNGFSSIGARTLSGEGYRGHIFWDTEIFLMPFYLFTFPEVAKNIILYRYRRLDKARGLAKKAGYSGAMFPWESADTGGEETPEWAKDLDGSIIKILTHKMEHHITSDIAYAVYKYYVATGEEGFMRDLGYEIMFASARFWASRVELDKKNKRYRIKGVIGPDEFHVNVNDNAYTNMMAKWNLFTANKLYHNVKKAFPSVYQGLQKKLSLTHKEVKEWKKIASLLSVNINKDKVIEQFDGYFRLKKIQLNDFDENGMPVLSRKIKTKLMDKTQFVKQPDALMLFHLLRDVYSFNTKKVNYDFYIKRILHKSSLSPSVTSIIACECRDMFRAYNLFNAALRTDISDLFGNTKEGIHGANLGGTWQAVVFGFAGVSVSKEKLCINPRMPNTWRKMVFSLLWRGNTVKLGITNDTIKLRVLSRNNKAIEIGVFDEIIYVKPNRNYVFKRKRAILAAGYPY